MTIKGRGMFSDSCYYENEILKNEDNTGIPAGSPDKVVKTMTLNMADIAFTPP